MALSSARRLKKRLEAYWNDSKVRSPRGPTRWSKDPHEHHRWLSDEKHRDLLYLPTKPSKAVTIRKNKCR
jgi:hypothetical protein